MLDLGTLRSDGGGNSEATGINNSGLVVGRSDADSGGRAFVWSNGWLSDLGVLPGDVASGAFAVNNKSQIVGYSRGPTYLYPVPTHAVLWQNGTIVDLGALPGESQSSSYAYAINDNGQVAGASGSHAFLWDKGVMTDLGLLPGGSFASARGINNRGQITGWATTKDGFTHGFLWDKGAMTDLGTLDNTCCAMAFSINNAGLISGASAAADGSGPAVIWEKNGAILRLYLPPGGFYPVATGYGINNSGAVAGSAYTAAGLRAFLWRQGETIDLGTLPGTYSFPSSEASAINDRGDIAGYSTAGALGYRHALLITKN